MTRKNRISVGRGFRGSQRIFIIRTSAVFFPGKTYLDMGIHGYTVCGGYNNNGRWGVRANWIKQNSADRALLKMPYCWKCSPVRDRVWIFGLLPMVIAPRTRKRIIVAVNHEYCAIWQAATYEKSIWPK